MTSGPSKTHFLEKKGAKCAGKIDEMRRKIHPNPRKEMWKQSLQNEGEISKADCYLSGSTQGLCCFHPNPLFYSFCLFISGTASPVLLMCVCSSTEPRVSTKAWWCQEQGDVMDSAGHSFMFSPSFLSISPRKVVSGAM